MIWFYGISTLLSYFKQAQPIDGLPFHDLSKAINQYWVQDHWHHDGIYQYAKKKNYLDVDGTNQYSKNHHNIPDHSSIIAIFSFLFFHAWEIKI